MVEYVTYCTNYFLISFNSQIILLQNPIKKDQPPNLYLNCFSESDYNERIPTIFQLEDLSFHQTKVVV